MGNEDAAMHIKGSAHVVKRTGFTLKRAGGLSGLAGAFVVVVAVLTSQAAAAGGNPNFEGILSAAAPTGFMSSPDAYDISGGPVTVDFDVLATNLTDTTQTVALNFSAHHILTYNGVDVSDGQPGQPGITFSGPTGTTQALIPGTQPFSATWDPKGGAALSLTYSFDACGYYQLDVWAPIKGGDSGRDRATLASGFIRVLGCDATPTPSPTGGVGGATATPTGGVQGITTPSTGSGDGWLAVGTALVIAGAGMLIAGKRRRRIDI